MSVTAIASSMASMNMAHLVIPGQVIATSSTSNDRNNNSMNDNVDDGFLRGHGTYVESNKEKEEDQLIASVCGLVHRVNKLITVIPYCESIYRGNVGDLVIGRISSVNDKRWTVQISASGCTMKDATMPLSAVHLPGGAQRLRTAQDSLNMRSFLREGDLICAEVHKVQQMDGSLSLHTRSHRFTKLENGILIKVPPALIARRKSHVLSLLENQIDVLWGVNGNIWLQRKMNGGDNSDKSKDNNATGSSSSSDKVADLQEKMRLEHANTPIDIDIRRMLCRLRNSIECLRMVHTMCTPENTEIVYHKSLNSNSQSCNNLTMSIPDMLLPENILLLTEEFRTT